MSHESVVYADFPRNPNCRESYIRMFTKYKSQVYSCLSGGITNTGRWNSSDVCLSGCKEEGGIQHVVQLGLELTTAHHANLFRKEDLSVCSSSTIGLRFDSIWKESSHMPIVARATLVCANDHHTRTTTTTTTTTSSTTTTTATATATTIIIIATTTTAAAALTQVTPTLRRNGVMPVMPRRSVQTYAAAHCCTKVIGPTNAK